MNEEIKELLTDCANFIQPYVEGGDEAETLLDRLDKVLEQGQDLPLHPVMLSSISYLELNDMSKEYADDHEGLRRLDFYNGCLALKQRLEETQGEA